MTRILRGLTSRRLTCGCVEGVYETYDGRVIAVFDAVSESCRVPGHAPGKLDTFTDVDVQDQAASASA